MAYVVATQLDRMATALKMAFFDGMREGGLAGTGQSGEPKAGATMVIALFTPGAGDGSVVPDEVVGRDRDIFNGERLG